MKYYYDIVDNYDPKAPPNVEEAFEFEIKNTNWPNEIFIENMAQDYYDNHDGWEYDNSCWPLTFRLWNDKKEHVGDYSVELEFSPSFYAYEKKE